MLVTPVRTSCTFVTDDDEAVVDWLTMLAVLFLESTNWLNTDDEVEDVETVLFRAEIMLLLVA